MSSSSKNRLVRSPPSAEDKSDGRPQFVYTPPSRLHAGMQSPSLQTPSSTRSQPASSGGGSGGGGGRLKSSAGNVASPSAPLSTTNSTPASPAPSPAPTKSRLSSLWRFGSSESPSSSTTNSPSSNIFLSQPPPSATAFEALKREFQSKLVLLNSAIENSSRLQRENMHLRGELSKEQMARADSDVATSVLQREKAELEIVVSTCKAQVEEMSRASRARMITRNNDGGAANPNNSPAPVGTRAKFASTLSSLLSKITLTPSLFSTSTPASPAQTTKQFTLPPPGTPYVPPPAGATAASVPNSPGLEVSPAAVGTACSSTSTSVEAEELRQLRFLTQHFHSVLSDTESQVLELQDSLSAQREANTKLQKELLLAAHMQEQARGVSRTLAQHRAQIDYLTRLNTDLEEALEKQDSTIEALSEQQSNLQRALETTTQERDEGKRQEKEERERRKQNDVIIRTFIEQNNALNEKITVLTQEKDLLLTQVNEERMNFESTLHERQVVFDAEYAQMEESVRTEKQKLLELFDSQSQWARARTNSEAKSGSSTPTSGRPQMSRLPSKSVDCTPTHVSPPNPNVDGNQQPQHLQPASNVSVHWPSSLPPASPLNHRPHYIHTSSTASALLDSDMYPSRNGGSGHATPGHATPNGPPRISVRSASMQSPPAHPHSTGSLSQGSPHMSPSISDLLASTRSKSSIAGDVTPSIIAAHDARVRLQVPASPNTGNSTPSSSVHASPHRRPVPSPKGSPSRTGIDRGSFPGSPARHPANADAAAGVDDSNNHKEQVMADRVEQFKVSRRTSSPPSFASPTPFLQLDSQAPNASPPANGIATLSTFQI